MLLAESQKLPGSYTHRSKEKKGTRESYWYSGLLTSNRYCLEANFKVRVWGFLLKVTFFPLWKNLLKYRLNKALILDKINLFSFIWKKLVQDKHFSVKNDHFFPQFYFCFSEMLAEKIRILLNIVILKLSPHHCHR